MCGVCGDCVPYQHLPNGTLIPRGYNASEVYYPIVYVDPMLSSILLFDLGADVDRLHALNLSVCRGDGQSSVASVPVSLVDDIEEWKTVVVIVSSAVYVKSLPCLCLWE